MEDLDIRLLVDLLRDRITPNRSLGQHFLLDEAVIKRAVEIAAIPLEKTSASSAPSKAASFADTTSELMLEILE